MSTHLIESEALRFLSSGEPEVLCLSGRWGRREDFRMEKVP